MIYYANEIKKILEDNIETVILYTFGSLVCDDDGMPYKEVYKWELMEYVNTIAHTFDELLLNRQLTLTKEKIQFLLELEMIGITCSPHAYKNTFDMSELAKKLLVAYMDKLVEINIKSHLVNA